MKSISKLCAFLAVFAALAFAENWSGKLIDAKCASEQKGAACAPTASTTAFALEVSGKIYKLDAGGNTKAAEAVKSSADRAKDPNAKTEAQAVNAKVTGTMEGDTINVESIELQ